VASDGQTFRQKDARASRSFLDYGLKLTFTAKATEERNWADHSCQFQKIQIFFTIFLTKPFLNLINTLT